MHKWTTDKTYRTRFVGLRKSSLSSSFVGQSTYTDQKKPPTLPSLRRGMSTWPSNGLFKLTADTLFLYAKRTNIGRSIYKTVRTERPQHSAWTDLYARPRSPPQHTARVPDINELTMTGAPSIINKAAS